MHGLTDITDSCPTDPRSIEKDGGEEARLDKALTNVRRMLDSEI